MKFAKRVGRFHYIFLKNRLQIIWNYYLYVICNKWYDNKGTIPIKLIKRSWDLLVYVFFKRQFGAPYPHAAKATRAPKQRETGRLTHKSGSLHLSPLSLLYTIFLTDCPQHHSPRVAGKNSSGQKISNTESWTNTKHAHVILNQTNRNSTINWLTIGWNIAHLGKQGFRQKRSFP